MHMAHAHVGSQIQEQARRDGYFLSHAHILTSRLHLDCQNQDDSPSPAGRAAVMVDIDHEQMIKVLIENGIGAVLWITALVSMVAMVSCCARVAGKAQGIAM